MANTLLRASVTVDAAGVEGADAPVVVDGADTPITAGGLAGYTPTAGDRLLVAKVGGVLEIIQYLSRGTPPSLDGAYLGPIDPSQILDGTIDADVTLNGSLRTTDAGGRVIEQSADGGWTVYEEDGSVGTVIPADPSQPKQFSGQVIADVLTVLAGLSIRGSDASIERGSTVTLQSSVGQPNVVPGASFVYPTATVTQASDLDNNHGLEYDSDDDTLVYCTSVGTRGVVHKINKTTAVETFSTSLLGPSNVDNLHPDGGITKIGSTWYVLAHPDGSPKTWYVYRYDESWNFLSRWQYTQDPDGKQPAIGHNATGDICIARCADNDGKINVRTYDKDTGNNQTLAFESNTAFFANCTSVYKDTFDFADNCWVVSLESGAPTSGQMLIYNADNSGARVTNREWPRANAATVTGLAWDGVRFFHLSNSGKVVQYSQNQWTTAADKWWLYYTWYDSDATGGTHESSVSPGAGFNMVKRSWLRVSVPSIPDLGGTDDPNAARIYLSRGTSEPANSSRHLNDTIFGPATSEDFDDVDFTTGAAPPTSNNFPGATPGNIKSSSGSILAAGDDTGWMSYTPTLNNWTLANGTLTGRYRKQAKHVDYHVEYTVGSSDTKSGVLGVSLPLPMSSGWNGVSPIGTAIMFDTSAGDRRVGVAEHAGAGGEFARVRGTQSGATGQTADPTTPWTWATGDTFIVTGFYEAA